MLTRSLVVLSAAMLFAAGCSVNVEGAACDGDQNCPDGQWCADDTKTCRIGTRPGPGTDGGSTDGGVDGGNCAPSDCAIGTAKACGLDGTVVTCERGDNGCGVFPPDSGVVCASGTVCLRNGDTASCGCPEKGDTAGTACETANERRCSGDTVLHCVDTNGCKLWTASTDCGALGLSCGDGQNGSVCQCPDYKGSIIHANPLKGHDPGGDVAVNGTDAKSACQFRRLTDALAATATNGAVQAHGFPKFGTWTANHAYAAGDRISPTKRNVTGYEAVTGGTSGATEPAAWPITIGSTVGDGTVTWKAIGPDWVAFDDEPAYPVVVPPSRIVSGECPNTPDGGTDCDPTRYAVVANGPASTNAQAVLKLGADDTLAAISVAAGDGGTGATGILCDTGKVALGAVSVFGTSNAGAQLARGIAITQDCGLTANGVGAFLVNGPGLEVNTTQSTILVNGYFGLYDPASKLSLGNTNGIVFKKGAVEANGLTVSGSTGDGIVVTATETLNLANVILGHNGETAVGANAGSGARISSGTVNFFSLLAGSNGRSGVKIDGGNVSISPSQMGAGSAIDDNGTRYTLFSVAPNAGIEVTGGTLTAQKLSTSQNAGAGIAVAGMNASATVTGLVASGNMIGAGISAGSGANAKLYLTDAAIDSNAAQGLVVEAGQVSLTGNSSVSGNGKTAAMPTAGVTVTGGVLSIDGSTAAAKLIPVTDSGADGVNVTGGEVTLTSVAVSQNKAAGASGLHVGKFQSANVAVTSCQLNENADNGVLLTAGTVDISLSDLAKNGRAGAVIVGTSEPLQSKSLTLNACTVHDNGLTGIANLSAGTLQPKISINNSDITANGTMMISGQIPSGVSMQASADLVFTGNKVHGNRGRQMSFSVPPKPLTPAAPWNIASAGCAAGSSSPNQIYCYDMPTGTPPKLPGLEAGMGVNVNATNLFWANNPPLANQDWSGAGVSATSACGAVTAVCP